MFHKEGMGRARRPYNAQQSRRICVFSQSDKEIPELSTIQVHQVSIGKEKWKAPIVIDGLVRIA